MYEPKSGASRVVTLADVFADFRRARTLAPSTVLNYTVLLDRCLSDWLSRPIQEITKQEVAQRHFDLSTDAPKQANVVMRVLRALMNFAACKYEDEKGFPLVKVNPVKYLSLARAWNKEGPRKVYIKDAQLEPWFRAVNNLKSCSARDFLILLALTGLRKGELASLEWIDVDLDDAVITVRDTKNGEDHSIPLSDYALKLLSDRRARARRLGSYVFPGRGRSFISANGSLADPVRLATGLDFTLHDLRRTFITVAHTLDFSPYTIKHLANHKAQNDNDVTFRYIQKNPGRLRKPMQQITDYFAEKSNGALYH